jgi:hypothetical protein
MIYGRQEGNQHKAWRADNWRLEPALLPTAAEATAAADAVPPTPAEVLRAGLALHVVPTASICG